MMSVERYGASRWTLIRLAIALVIGGVIVATVAITRPEGAPTNGAPPAGAPPANSPMADAPSHRPMIIVHGLKGMRPWGVLPSVFPEFVDRFKAAGWTDKDMVVFEYDWKQPNIRTAEQLAATVERVRPKTGNPEADKVDIVAHSMGSLSSRYFIKFLGGQDKVAHWVSIGGVNHGSRVPCPGVVWKSCRDLSPNSEMIKRLNTGDETPGAVRYQTQRSTCDELAVPHSTVPLAGADNQSVGCLEHIYMPKSKKVFETTRDFLLR
jgi:triacylglycerol lipase